MKKITEIMESVSKSLKDVSTSELHRRVRAAEAHPSRVSDDARKGANAAKQELIRREREDEEQGHHIHSLTSTEHLASIVKGKIDPVHLAKKELANRGLDSDGKWVGFEKAHDHHFGGDKKHSPRALS